MKALTELKVLFLEEGERSTRAAAWDELKPKGVLVTPVRDRETCLAKLAEDPEWLVLLDIDTTKKSIEALQDIKKVAPEAIVIVLASQQKLALVDEALVKGAWDFLIKRPDLSHLQEIPQAIARNRERKKLRLERDRIARDSECFTVAARANRDGMVVAHKGQIVFANAALRQFLGYEDGGLAGVSVEEFFPELEIDEESWTSLSDPVARREWRGQTAVRKKDGSRAKVAAILTEILNAEGEAEALVGFCLEPRAGVAVDSRQVQGAPDEIINGIVEDFKTPLAAMIGYLQVASSSEASEESQRLLSLQRVDALANRLLDMVTDHISAHGIEAGRFDVHKVPLQIDQILASAVHGRKSEAEAKEIELVLKAGKNIPAMPVDPTQLERAFSIVISNAITVSPLGGSVSVVSALKGKGVTIVVTDSGAGVSAEDIPFLFDRTKKVAKRGVEINTVGLFVARHIVQAHGGRLEAESEPAEGTTLTIFLPL